MNKNFFMLQYNKDNILLRQIRSFVSRNRQLTLVQKRTLKNSWSQLGLVFQQSYLNFNAIFNNNFPVVLEIGFGTGESFVSMAQNNIFKNFLGVEVYIPGIYSCTKLINLYKLNNIRLIAHDAVEVLLYMVLNNSLSIIQIFFPDPWFKKRHNKRRIINQKFAILVLKKLVVGGLLHIVTDNESYAQEIVTIMSTIKGFIVVSPQSNDFCKFITRSITKFEKKALRLNNKIFDLRFMSI